jgi:hypothetical protein
LSDNFPEYHINLNFLVKLKEMTARSYRLLEKVYGESAVLKELKFEWRNQFSGRREDIHDESQSAQPTTVKIDENVENMATCFYWLKDDPLHIF